MLISPAIWLRNKNATLSSNSHSPTAIIIVFITPDLFLTLHKTLAKYLGHLVWRLVPAKYVVQTFIQESVIISKIHKLKFLYLRNMKSAFQHQHDRALKTTVTLKTSSKTTNSSKTTTSKAKAVSKSQARIISLQHPEGSQQTDCCLFRLLLPKNQQS